MLFEKKNNLCSSKFHKLEVFEKIALEFSEGGRNIEVFLSLSFFKSVKKSMSNWFLNSYIVYYLCISILFNIWKNWTRFFNNKTECILRPFAEIFQNLRKFWKFQKIVKNWPDPRVYIYIYRFLLFKQKRNCPTRRRGTRAEQTDRQTPRRRQGADLSTCPGSWWLPHGRSTPSLW